MRIQVILSALILCATAATTQAQIKIQGRVEAFNLLGDPISAIPVGSDFELRAFVDDVRTSTPIKGQSGEDLFGIFAAYVDVAFDASKVVATGPVVVDVYFDGLDVVSSVSPGLAEGGGATLEFPNPGPAEQLLFTLPMTASAVGTVSFSPSFFGDAFHEWLVFGDNDPVAANEVLFSDFELTVVPEPTGLVPCAMGLVAVGALVLRSRRRRGQS